MAKMITTVEDDTDEKFVESRRYRYNTNMIVQSKVRKMVVLKLV